MTEIGPVQLLVVGFGPDAKFEGRVIDELVALEESRQLLVLDILFVGKGRAGELYTLDYQAEGMGDTVAALLGIPKERIRAAEAEVPSLSEGHAFGLGIEAIRAMADSLDEGTSAAYVLLEHVWARRLRSAIRDTGGVPVAEGFLTREALESVLAEVAAAAARREGPEKGRETGDKRKRRP